MSDSSVTVQSKITLTGTLLVVDDDAPTLRLLTKIFEKAGHKVLTAPDATTALRLLHKERCDLVVLDIEMPDVDGLSLCRLMRAQAAMRQIPIIILSANDDDERKAEAFESGANDYLIKPATPFELLSHVQIHLENARRTSALLGSNRELMFLADLGRSLLRAFEPEQVVRQVAGMTYDAAEATLCAIIVGIFQDDNFVCVFDREGSAEGADELNFNRLVKWAELEESSDSAFVTNSKNFFLRDKLHAVEYITPLRFGGRTQGALIVGYDREENCTETARRLVDAAAQQAAMAAHISSLYDAARDASIFMATEEQRRFTEAIIDTLPVSLYVINRGFNVVAWNRNRELGDQGIPRQDVIGKNIFDVLTKQSRKILQEEFERAFKTGQIERIEQETISDEGEKQYWLISKIPMRDGFSREVTHVITLGEDITARVEANRAIARAEKLAAVGKLAAGVVHEINNPLATISACAEAMENRVNEGVFGDSRDVQDLRDYLKLIRDEAFRCKSITNGLLDFARTRVGQKLPLNVSNVVNAAARLITHQRRNEAVKVQVETSNDLQLVNGDEGQLQQAIIALSTNALDAMPEGGVLILSTSEQEGNVKIEIRDTGLGIAPENLTKIFDPFFTTKEVGKGTGLGLAVCYGIVTDHGGRLDVESTEGVGTVFTISLPALRLTKN
jgi:two-component system NtrC family sensor kinase